ncbi:MAG: heparinase II/III family protein [Opitutaceae bacterium]
MMQSPYPEIGLIRRNFEHPALASVRSALENRVLGEDYRLIEEAETNDQTQAITYLAGLIEEMVLYHAASGRSEPADLALAAVEKVMEFPRWDYFLEAGRIPMAIQRASRAVTAVSYAIEFLGDRVSRATRDRWLDAMITRGIEPNFVCLEGLRHPEQVVGWGFDPGCKHLERYPEQIHQDFSRWPWILYPTNLRAASMNGMLTGAVCVLRSRGRSADTDRWIEMAEHHFETFGDLFCADGSNDEGVSYSGYTALQVLEVAVHLQAIDGRDRSGVVNWPGYIRFLVGMHCPVAGNLSHVVNFGDCLTPASSEVVLWIAALYQSPIAQWVALNLSQALDAHALLRHDPDLEAEAPDEGPSLWKSDLDWIVGRTGHSSDDLVVALRSGGPFNHEHADRNSVIVKFGGEVLVVDPHRPPYMRTDPAWVMRTTLGHSAVLIDGRGHQYHDGSMGTNPSDAVARITNWNREGSIMTWSSDATQAYHLVNADVVSAIRSVLVITELPLVLIADRVAKKSVASKIQARFFVDNKDGNGRIEAADGRFKVNRPGAFLLGMSACDPAPVIRSARVESGPEMTDAYPYVEFESVESMTPFLLTVLVPVKTGSDAPVMAIDPVGDRPGQITVEGAGRKFTVIVDPAGNGPVFRVSSEGPGND